MTLVDRRSRSCQLTYHQLCCSVLVTILQVFLDLLHTTLSRKTGLFSSKSSKTSKKSWKNFVDGESEFNIIRLLYSFGKGRALQIKKCILLIYQNIYKYLSDLYDFLQQKFRFIGKMSGLNPVLSKDQKDKMQLITISFWYSAFLGFPSKNRFVK